MLIDAGEGYIEGRMDLESTDSRELEQTTTMIRKPQGKLRVTNFKILCLCMKIEKKR
jgi:hypothetical protein